MRHTLAPTITAVLLVAACGGGTDSGATGTTPLPESAPCPNANLTNIYNGLSLAPGIDGAVFAALGGDFDGGQVPRGTLGTPCGGASDPDGCRARVAAATATSGWLQGGSGRAGGGEYGIVTRGDDVRVITTVAELGATVAPIESLAEAAALAHYANRDLLCEPARNAQTVADGFILRTHVGGCSQPRLEQLFQVHRDGSITDVSQRQLEPATPGCVEGRRPAAYVASARPWLTSLSVHLAEIAHMEAAAVLAFAELGRELARHGAPGDLLARVDRARRDEIDHATIMRTRAAAVGARPAPVEHVALAPRTLLELALDNATEGCVREAYGAVIAAHQAAHAADPTLRRAFVRIARDEAVHAALSLDLAEWFATKLTAAERVLVAEAQAAAWAHLARECARMEPAPEVVDLAGMPTARVACALVAALRDALPLAA